MRFKRLDLNQVVVLDALLTERSVTKAGRRLHVSQTTVSDSLARLREYFKDELLTQVGRKMVPTPLGESLAAPARGMLLQAEAMLNTRPTFDPTGAVRNFTIMLSDYVNTVLMSKAIPILSALAPNITIELIGHSSIPWESMDRGEIDFLIMPEPYLSPGHPHGVLFSDSFSCIAWAENSLVEQTITQEKFLQLGHVVSRFGDNRSPSIEEWFFKRYGNARRVEIVAMDFSSVPQTIVGTNRIATIQTALADHYAKFLPIKVLSNNFELPTLTEAIQWNRFFDNDPGIIWMRHLLMDIGKRELM